MRRGLEESYRAPSLPCGACFSPQTHRGFSGTLTELKVCPESHGDGTVTGVYLAPGDSYITLCACSDKARQRDRVPMGQGRRVQGEPAQGPLRFCSGVLRGVNGPGRRTRGPHIPGLRRQGEPREPSWHTPVGAAEWHDSTQGNPLPPCRCRATCPQYLTGRLLSPARPSPAPDGTCG